MPERHTSGRGGWDDKSKSDFVKPNASGNRRAIADEPKPVERIEVEKSLNTDFTTDDFRARWWPMQESPRRGN